MNEMEEIYSVLDEIKRLARDAMHKRMNGPEKEEELAEKDALMAIPGAIDQASMEEEEEEEGEGLMTPHAPKSSGKKILMIETSKKPFNSIK